MGIRHNWVGYSFLGRIMTIYLAGYFVPRHLYPGGGKFFIIKVSSGMNFTSEMYTAWDILQDTAAAAAATTTT